MAKEFFQFFILIVFFWSSIHHAQATDSKLSFFDKTQTKCGVGNGSICIKIEVIKLIDLVDKQKLDFELFDGIRVVKESNDGSIGILKGKKLPFPWWKLMKISCLSDAISGQKNLTKTEHILNKVLATRIVQLLFSPSVQIKFLSSHVSGNETGRGKLGKHQENNFSIFFFRVKLNKNLRKNLGCELSLYYICH